MRKLVCFKCHGHGHYKDAYPNTRAFTAQEWRGIKEDTKSKMMLVAKNGGEDESWPLVPDDEPEGSYRVTESGRLIKYENSTKESELEEERERVMPEDEHYNLIVRRSLHTTLEEKESNQRENIFQTKCRVWDKVCDWIINGGNESNCVSLDLGTELNLKTRIHPHPYKLKWLDNNASGSMSKQFLVGFVIGSYKEKVLCDVLEMSACHVLLGRPWQYDRKCIHNGFTNTYTVRHEGKLKHLIPLPPHKAIPPPAKKPVHLMSWKVCEKELKSKNMIYVLFTKEVAQTTDMPPEVKPLLQQYDDVFHEDLPKGLPPIRGIEHQIDLIPGTPYPTSQHMGLTP